MSDKLLFAFVY